MDPLANHTGFSIDRAQVLRCARWVAGEAHRLGMAVLQKNGPELSRALEPEFDRAGKPVLDAEYRARLYPGFCSRDRTRGIEGALFNLA